MCFEAEVGGKPSQTGQAALHHIAAPKTLSLIKEPIDVLHCCSVSGLIHLWGHDYGHVEVWRGGAERKWMRKEKHNEEIVFSYWVHMCTSLLFCKQYVHC